MLTPIKYSANNAQVVIDTYAYGVYFEKASAKMSLVFSEFIASQTCVSVLCSTETAYQILLVAKPVESRRLARLRRTIPPIRHSILETTY